MKRLVRSYLADTVTCIEVAPAESSHRVNVVLLDDYDELLLKARKLHAAMQGMVDGLPPDSAASVLITNLLKECEV